MKVEESKMASVYEPVIPKSSDPVYPLAKKLGVNQPDLRRNPSLWPTFVVYGPSFLRKTVSYASGAERIADLGCGCGWLTLELARANLQARVEGVDGDAKLIEYAQGYSQSWPGLSYTASTVEAFELRPESYDLMVTYFLMGQLNDPGQLLSRIHRALKPGGVLVYYDACEPPPINLDRLAKLSHQWARARGKMSDLWSQRRRLLARYQDDPVRAQRPAEAPPEQHLYHRIEELFEVVFQARNRAFIDLSAVTVPARRRMLYFPLLKLFDELSITVGLLEGSCRFLVARKR